MFLDRPGLDSRGRLPVRGPGFGVRPDHSFLQANGRILAAIAVAS
jgi:hypothetical protein